MYHTPEGDRILRGAERALFVSALAVTLDEAQDAEWRVGIEVFDALQPSQRVAALHQIATALLEEQIAAPALSAVVEGTVAAVYQSLIGFIDDEIDAADLPDEFADCDASDREPKGRAGESDGASSVRAMLRRAARETRAVEEIPPLSESDRDEWYFVVDALRDRILWDNDWQGMSLPDLAPDDAETMKEFLGISEDYFVDVIPDPTADELARMLADIRHLLAT